MNQYNNICGKNYQDMQIEIKVKIFVVFLV